MLAAGDGVNIVVGDLAILSGLASGELTPREGGALIILATATDAVMGGADRITGGAGRDLLIGGQGADTILAGAGDDDIIGGHFIDAARQDVAALALSDGNNVIDAGDGHDVVVAGHGLIRTSASGFDPRLLTTAGTAAADPTGRPVRQILSHTDPQATADRFGNHTVAGGAGDDMLFGGQGHDLLLGDASLVMTAAGALDARVGANASILTGSAAYAYLAATRASAWKAVRSASATGAHLLMERKVAAGTEWLMGSVSALDGGRSDLIIVRPGAGSLPATAGDNYIEGGAGDDVLIGGAGADDLIGGSSRLFGAYIAAGSGAKAAAISAGADTILSGNADLRAAPVAGSALVAGNATVWKIVSGSQFAEAGTVAGVTRAVIRRAIELAESEPDTAAVSRLFSASKGDHVVASQAMDRTYGDMGAGRPGVNGAGQTSVVSKRTADLALLVNVIESKGPQISAASLDAAGVSASAQQAVAVSSASSVPLYLYKPASGGFEVSQPARRPVTAGAAGVMDISANPGGGYVYVDNLGGVWFHGTVPVTGDGGTGGGGGTGSGGDPVDPTIRGIGRSGQFTISAADVGLPVRVEFGASIANAVIALTGTQTGSEPYTLRIVDRDETGFRVVLQEWEYQDGRRTMPETIHWLAVEAGVHQLADGRVLEAGTVLADVSSGSVAFAAKFASAPVVLTSVMSDFNPEAVDSNPVSVTAARAELRLESEEARGKAAGKELVGYIAISTGTGTRRVTNAVDSTKRSFALGVGFADIVVLAEEQSAKQADAGQVRIGTVTNTSVELFFAEEQSLDTETLHGREDLGLVALVAGDLRGVRKADAAWVTKAQLDALAAARQSQTAVVGAAGTIKVAGASAGKPIRINFGNRIDNAVVVLTGTLDTMAEPYTLRVLSRDTAGFTFIVDEWEYQDGKRTDTVTVHWLAVQAGVHTLADGRVVEAGTLLADDSAGSVTFSAGFAAGPVVVTSVMSAIDATAVDASPISVTATGFEARLQSEQARAGFDRVQELVGYVAFGAGPNVKTLTSGSHFGMSVAFDGAVGAPVVLADTQTRKDADPQSTMIWTVATRSATLFLSEEQSAEADRRRSEFDTIGLAVFDKGLLTGTRKGDAAQVTAAQLAAAKAAGEAMLAVQNAVIGASGKATVTAAQVGKVIRVNFGTSIENAVVVLTGATASTSDPFTLRVLSRDATGFTFMLDEWEYQDGRRSASVTVNWVAVAAGVHRLADGRTIEAGTLLADGTSGGVSFSAGFAAGPAVITSVMSSLDATAVDSSALNVTATGFEARLQSEEARAGIPQSQELVGYIAFGLGGGAVQRIEAGASAVTMKYGRTYTNAVVVADSQTMRDTDPQSVLIAAQSTTAARFVIAEETSVSSNTGRSQTDTVGVAVLEAGLLRGQALGSAAMVTAAQLAEAASAPVYRAIGQSGSVTVTAKQAGNPIRVTYSSPITNAVVMLTGSYQSGDPYTLRVVARDDTGFSFVIEEWEYQNKIRMKTETIQWVAIAAGVHQLADGRLVEVGTVEADTSASAVTFKAGFASAPVVVTSVMSNRDTKTVDSSPTAITRNGFSVGLQVEKGQAQTHAKETVGYIAVAPGASLTGGLATTLGVSSVAKSWTAPAGFASLVVVADTQTRNSPNTASVKLKSLTSSGASLLIEKEASKSVDLSHPTETVGLLAFLKGMIYGLTR